jgi:hypothetical protein
MRWVDAGANAVIYQRHRWELAVKRLTKVTSQRVEADMITKINRVRYTEFTNVQSHKRVELMMRIILEVIITTVCSRPCCLEYNCSIVQVSAPNLHRR